MIDDTMYYEYGCENREDYLCRLSEEYGVPDWMVQTAAELLGPNEDFDGLISTLADYEGIIDE